MFHSRSAFTFNSEDPALHRQSPNSGLSPTLQEARKGVGSKQGHRTTGQSVAPLLRLYPRVCFLWNKCGSVVQNFIALRSLCSSERLERLPGRSVVAQASLGQRPLGSPYSGSQIAAFPGPPPFHCLSSAGYSRKSCDLSAPSGVPAAFPMGTGFGRWFESGTSRRGAGAVLLKTQATAATEEQAGPGAISHYITLHYITLHYISYIYIYIYI